MAYRPAINRCLRVVLRPAALLGPPRVLRRIPVVGRCRIDLPETGTSAVLVSAGGDGVLRRLYWGFGFEEPVRELWAHLARRSRTILDVGAHTGLYAVVAGLVQPEASIHAFEPVPGAFRELEGNLRANGLDRARAHLMALGDADGSVTLYVPESRRHLPTTASLDPGFRPRSRPVTVRGARLDTFLDEAEIRGVDLLKVDVESAEPQVLSGAVRMLDRDRPLVLCEVLEGLTEDALERILRPRDYRFFHVTAGGVRERRHIRGSNLEEDANYLFVPEESVQELAEAGRVTPRERDR